MKLDKNNILFGLNEDVIERYIRFPAELSQEQRQNIERAVKSSAELQNLVDFFQDLYADFDSLMKESNAVISLKFYQPFISDSRGEKVLLAAMTSELTEDLVTVSTLASEQDQTLVRVLRDSRTGEYKIHAIGKQLEKGSPAILSVADNKAELVLEDGHHLTFKPGNSFSDVDWETTSHLLRLPVETRALDFSDGEQENPIVVNISGVNLNISTKENSLEISTTNSTCTLPGISRIVARGEISGDAIIHLHSDKTVIPIEARDQKIQLWFYR